MNPAIDVLENLAAVKGEQYALMCTHFIGVQYIMGQVRNSENKDKVALILSHILTDLAKAKGVAKPDDSEADAMKFLGDVDMVLNACLK